MDSDEDSSARGWSNESRNTMNSKPTNISTTLSPALHSNRRRNTYNDEGGRPSKRYRGGPNHSKNIDSGPLKFDAWLRQQGDSVKAEDAIEKYGDYEAPLLAPHLKTFFESFKAHEWFRERYHPDHYEKHDTALCEAASERLRVAMDFIDAGKFDNVSFTNKGALADLITSVNQAFELTGAKMSDKPLQSSETEAEDEGAQKPNDEPKVLFITEVPFDMTYKTIFDAYMDVPGFKRLALSYPSAKSSRRVGWIVFDCYVDLQAAEKQVREKVLDGGPLNFRADRGPPSVRETEQSEIDLDLIKRLAKSFDDRRHLWRSGPNPLLDGNDHVKLILYLRVVHSFDYFSAQLFIGEHDRGRRLQSMFVPKESIETKQRGQWKWKQDLEGFARPPPTPMQARKMGWRSAEEAISDFVESNIQELSKDKFMCKLKPFKKFKTADFVRKHILNKQGESVEFAKFNQLFFNNYIMDSCRPLKMLSSSTGETSSSSKAPYKSPTGIIGGPQMLPGVPHRHAFRPRMRMGVLRVLRPGFGGGPRALMHPRHRYPLLPRPRVPIMQGFRSGGARLRTRLPGALLQHQLAPSGPDYHHQDFVPPDLRPARSSVRQPTYLDLGQAPAGVDVLEF